jgi:hypothetical protein
MLTVAKLAIASSLLVAGSFAPAADEPAVVAQPTLVGGNHAPFCNDPPSQLKPCAGSTTQFTLDASGASDPDGDPFTVEWLPCPGATVADATATITTLTLDTSSDCNKLCGVRLRLVDIHGATFVCRTYVQVYPGSDGCSPGYWKNHPESWAAAGFAPTDDFDTVFGCDAFSPDKTLMQALWTGGGGIKKLGRMAVSALLNAGHPSVFFPRTVNQVINQVRNAVNTGVYEPLATDLDRDNNLDCTID